MVRQALAAEVLLLPLAVVLRQAAAQVMARAAAWEMPAQVQAAAALVARRELACWMVEHPPHQSHPSHCVVPVHQTGWSAGWCPPRRKQ